MSALEEVYVMIEALKILLPKDCNIDTMQDLSDRQKMILNRAKKILNES